MVTTLKPIFTVKHGRVRVAIRHEVGKHGHFYSLSLYRRYESDGQWKSTTSFAASDIPAIQEAFTQAKRWIETQS